MEKKLIGLDYYFNIGNNKIHQFGFNPKYNNDIKPIIYMGQTDIENDQWHTYITKTNEKLSYKLSLSVNKDEVKFEILYDKKYYRLYEDPDIGKTIFFDSLEQVKDQCGFTRELCIDYNKITKEFNFSAIERVPLGMKHTLNVSHCIDLSNDGLFFKGNHYFDDKLWKFGNEYHLVNKLNYKVYYNKNNYITKVNMSFRTKEEKEIYIGILVIDDLKCNSLMLLFSELHNDNCIRIQKNVEVDTLPSYQFLTDVQFSIDIYRNKLDCEIILDKKDNNKEILNDRITIYL